MFFQPLFKKPILNVENGDHRILLFGDLHIGREFRDRKKGLILRYDIQNFVSDLVNVLDEIQADIIVLLGDIKDDVYRSESVTNNHLILLFSQILAKCPRLVLVKGNHDGLIEKDLPENIEYIGPTGGVVEGIGVFHGHAWPSKEVLCSKLVVTAHNHTTFASELNSRSSHYYRCWIKGKLDFQKVGEYYAGMKKETLIKSDFIVLPSFRRFGQGVVINGDDDFIGPVLKNGLLDLEKSHIFLLDGTELGRLSVYR